MADGRVRVLLVEGDHREAALLQRHLSEAAGPDTFELTHLTRVAEALRHLADAEVDVLLLDLSLPDGDDRETLARVCAAAPHLPIVVVTGCDDEALALQALQLGAQDYLVKAQLDGKWLARALRYAIERHRMQATLRSLALIDDLTGLYNRRGFRTLAGEQLKLARRSGRELSLVFADLDDLKAINDTLGHEEGDQALIETARILKATFRESYIIARLGGDEFTILAFQAPADTARTLVSRLQQRLDAHNQRPGRRYLLSVSFGVAGIDPTATTSVEALMAKADQALLEQKQQKRARTGPT